MIYIILFLIQIVYGFDIHSKIFNNIIKNNHKNALDDIYNLVNQQKNYGYLSSIHFTNKLKDYPHSSLVGCSIDDEGYPILCMSDISLHTQNIKKNNKISLIIPKYGLKNQSEKRVTFTGNINTQLDKNYNNILKEKYLIQHPEAFWLKYIDFNMYKLDNIKDIYYIGGFGKATKISVKKYLENYHI